MDVNAIKENPTNPWNYAALGADLVGTAVPVGTGFGLGVKTIENGGNVNKAISSYGKTMQAPTRTVTGSTNVAQSFASSVSRITTQQVNNAKQVITNGNNILRVGSPAPGVPARVSIGPAPKVYSNLPTVQKILSPVIYMLKKIR